MMVIGIDPGVAGALIVLDENARLWEFIDMPTVEVRGKRRIDPVRVVGFLGGYDPRRTRAVIEDVQGVQGSGATSAFTFGRGVGILEGILATIRIPTTWVRPQQWTRDLGVGADKGAHRQAAMRLHPDDAHLFARVKDDGRADAALLAHWATRTMTAAT